MTTGFVSAPDGDLKNFVFTPNVFLIEQSIGGQLFTYGANQTGALGDNTTVNKSSPIQTVSTDITWQQMACSGFITVGGTAGIKTDGTLWTWGNNSKGQLGLGNTTDYSSPKQVGALTTWFASSGGLYHNLALAY